MQSTIDGFFKGSDEGDESEYAKNLEKSSQQRKEDKERIEYRKGRKAAWVYGQIKKGITTFDELLIDDKDLLVSYGYIYWVEETENEYGYFKVR